MNDEAEETQTAQSRQRRPNTQAASSNAMEVDSRRRTRNNGMPADEGRMDADESDVIEVDTPTAEASVLPAEFNQFPMSANEVSPPDQNIDWDSFEFIRISKSWTTKDLNDSHSWYIYIQGILVQSADAYERVLQNETRLGSKSTASIFLLAVRHCLSQVESGHLGLLLGKVQAASPEFSRKLAFRLLSNERPDKLAALIKLIIHYPVRSASAFPQANWTQNLQQLVGVNNPESMAIDTNDIIPSLSLVLKITKQVILATVDVRLVIMKEHGLFVKWLVCMIYELARLHFTLNSAAIAEVIESALKCLQDLALVAEKEHFALFEALPVVDMMIQLVKSNSEGIIDDTVKLLLYAYDFASEKFQQMVDDSSLFSEILTQLMTNPSTQLRILDHLTTHLLVRVPLRLRKNYFGAILALKEQTSENAQQFAVRINRCLNIMALTGIRVAVFAINKEIVENRRSKQVWMKRQCEGCQKTEASFGEFMMCAGCRKVRYCSKDCQVRDWKYHRMSCHFFRPKPGFRSRGTQTAVDSSCQTEESSFDYANSSNKDGFRPALLETNPQSTPQAMELDRQDQASPSASRQIPSKTKSTSAAVQQNDDDDNNAQGSNNEMRRNSSQGLDDDSQSNQTPRQMVSTICQTEESYPVNYLMWKYSGRRDEGTSTLEH